MLSKCKWSTPFDFIFVSSQFSGLMICEREVIFNNKYISVCWSISWLDRWGKSCGYTPARISEGILQEISYGWVIAYLCRDCDICERVLSKSECRSLIISHQTIVFIPCLLSTLPNPSLPTIIIIIIIIILIIIKLVFAYISHSKCPCTLPTQVIFSCLLLHPHLKPHRKRNKLINW